MACQLLRILLLRSFSILIVTYLITVSIGCGGGAGAGSTPTAPSTPTTPAAPSITSITPSTIPAGSSAFTLQINGSGFVSGSVVSWNGTNLATTYVSATELTAAVPASLAASGGTFAITVANPDGQNSGSSSTNATIVVDNPVPVITSLSPASVMAGSGAINVVVTGTGFVQNSVASFAGNARTTTVQSTTQLTMALTMADLATAGQINVTVTNPSPGGGVSAPITFTVTPAAPVNPVPTITSLSPASVTAGSGATNVVVTGTGFIQSSIASFAGNTRATTVQSSTQLTMALTAADLAAANQVNVTVTNPSPGGGVSAPATFTVTQTPPVITGITPTSLVVGSPATPVTISGTGFRADSRVLVDNFPQVPSSVMATAINITIPASYFSAANLIQLQVESGSFFSNTFSLSVVNPVPAIQSLSIPTVTAGSPTFNLTINATGVVNDTQVNVNGEPVTPVPGFGSTIIIPIAASLMAQVGTVSISLTNPAPGGGTSNIAKLNVIAGSNYLRAVNLPANALVWDPKQKVIYAAVPASSSSNASSVVAIDPTNGKIVATEQMPSEPTLLALSGDQQYLYVGMSAIAAISRLKLPALTPDIQWSVGHLPTSSGVRSIFDMHVAPGLPHTIAVVQEGPGVVNQELDQPDATELAIYDDGVKRQNAVSGAPVTTIQWGADASTIYGTENVESGGPEFIYQINAQGATLSDTILGAFADFVPQFLYDSSKTRLYDSRGDVVDPATGKLLGSFPVNTNSLAVDSSQHRVYFMGLTPYPDGVNSANNVTQISVYDQDHFTIEGTIALPAVNSNGGVPIYGGENLLRWGNAGLAFNFGSNIYILDGPFVTPGAAPTSSVGTYATPPPQLTGLSPESVIAGSPDTTITLTGQNLTPATTVTWNNNILTTTFVSDTEVQATIPAAALSAPTAGPLYVENSPGEGIANVLAFSVLPNLGSGMQLTALNLSGSDLAWNASNNVLYVAVTSDDSIHPQTIAAVNPTKGTIVSTVPASANPFVLSISGDDKYLYAGFANYANVQRYTLPSLTPDLLIPLGIGEPAGSYAAGSTHSCDFAVSMGVAPGLDNTIAVTQGNEGIDILGCGATVVIDGATPRPVNTSVFTSTGHDFSELTWGADATAVYTQGTEYISWQPISALTVSSSGIVFDQSSSADTYLGYRPHFDAGTGLIYSDGGGITQPSTLSQVGNFNASGLMVPDSTLGLAYFLGQTPSQGNGAQGTIAFTLQIYDLHSFALLDSIVIPNVIGHPNQMIRWGASGIAFTTENGDFEGNNAPGLTYILNGSEISKPSAAVRQKSMGAEHVHLTWKPRQTMRATATGGKADN
jgi:hypothetical protein